MPKRLPLQAPDPYGRCSSGLQWGQTPKYLKKHHVFVIFILPNILILLINYSRDVVNTG